MGCPHTEPEVIVVVVVVAAAVVSSSSSSGRKAEYTLFCKLILHAYGILVTLQG
jgi:hypothetical protein